MSLVPSLRTQASLSRNRSPDLRERRSRSPSHTLTRNLDLIIQLINLLKRKTLGLVDHEVDECDAEEAACEPDEEDLRLEIGISRAPVDEVGCRVSDSPVQEPICGGGHGERLCTNLEREDLSCHDPGDWSPGGSEEEDVDADESNGSLLRGEVLGEHTSVCVLAGCGGTEDSNEKLADGHSNS